MGTFLTNGSLLEDITGVITSGIPYVLTDRSATIFDFTGSTAQEVKLPSATTLVTGVHYLILNNSSAVLTVKDADSNILTSILPAYYTDFRVLDTATMAGRWMQETEDGFFNLLRLLPHPTSTSSISVTGTVKTLASGITIGQELEGYPIEFQGASVDFLTGTILDSLGDPLGLNFTPPTITTDEYLWYNLVAEYTGVSSGKVSIRIRATPAATSSATIDGAVFPRFPFLSRIIKLGFVLVKENTGNIEVVTIRQLGVSGGASGGGGGGSLAAIAGSLLERGNAVSMSLLGNAEITDISSEDSSYAICGVVQDNANENDAVSILTSGAVLIDIPVGFGLTGEWGKPVFVSPTGTLTLTKPAIGSDDFLPGHFIVRMGVLVKNTEGTTDLLVNPQIVGQL